MLRINREVNAPTLTIQIEGGKIPLLPAKELEAMGFNVVVYPISALYAASRAVRRVMEELISKGTTRDLVGEMISFSEFNRLIGLNQIREKEASYYKERD